MIKLLTEKELSELINISVKKLQRDRQQRIGIKFKKIGSCVRYSLQDVQQYLQQQTVEMLSNKQTT